MPKINLEYFSPSSRYQNMKISKYSDVWHRCRLMLKTIHLLKKSSLNIGKQALKSDSHQILTTDCELMNEKAGSDLESSLITTDYNETFNAFELPFPVIHPESRLRKTWNFITSVLLIYTATVMPYEIAFIDSYPYDSWFIMGLVIDSLFFIDILMNCITAYYDSEKHLVTMRSMIFCHYLKSWLILDLIACFPFDLVEKQSDSGNSSQNSGGYSSMTKLVRLPRLYRLFRISRILKLLKNKGNNKYLERIQDFLSIRNSVMRMGQSCISIVLFLHITSCLWYFTAKLDNFEPETWVTRYSYIDSDNGTIYLTSLYWAITTLCTVGYGDISAGTNFEKFLAICWMMFGLFFFSLTISSISSMMSSIDSK